MGFQSTHTNGLQCSITLFSHQTSSERLPHCNRSFYLLFNPQLICAKLMKSSSADLLNSKGVMFVCLLILNRPAQGTGFTVLLLIDPCPLFKWWWQKTRHIQFQWWLCANQTVCGLRGIDTRISTCLWPVITQTCWLDHREISCFCCAARRRKLMITLVCA